MLFILLVNLGCACDPPLYNYTKYNHSPIDKASPLNYINYVKNRQETKCNLRDLPDKGIILYYANTSELLNSIGIPPSEYEACEIGTTAPSELFIVKQKSGNAYVINRGLPGAGGVATQVAELGALGVKYVIHIGTAGLLGSYLPNNSLILSIGSYKDGASYLMPVEDPTNKLAFPDLTLNKKIEEVFKQQNITYEKAVGFTTPVIYYQPLELIAALIIGKKPNHDPVARYIEMEEAPFFTAAKIAKVKAASIVVGSDRTVILNEKLTANFIPFKECEMKALENIINVFDQMRH
jgi:purine-nucleoside phosphorylase